MMTNAIIGRVDPADRYSHALWARRWELGLHKDLARETIHSANPTSVCPRADSFHTFSDTVHHPDISAPTGIEGSHKKSVEKLFWTLGNAGPEQVTDGSSRARRLFKKAVQQGRSE